MANQDLAPQAVVIFGASGDLTKRKLLPAFYHLYLQGLLPKGFAIIGYSRTEMSDDAFRDMAKEAIEKYAEPPRGGVWNEFAKHLSYHPGEFGEPMAMKRLGEQLERVDEEFGTEGGATLQLEARDLDLARTIDAIAAQLAQPETAH